MRENPRVLVVQADPESRETLSLWLEAAGNDVTACPGPSAPTYVCIGDRTGTCPLLAESDVVVLDCRLDEHGAPEGTSAADLLSLYVGSGRPVVALCAEGLAGLFADDDVVFLGKEAISDREGNGALVEAVAGAVNATVEDRSRPEGSDPTNR